MTNSTLQFLGKYIVRLDMKCIGGLHIGGTDEGFEIGGLDNPVIKDPITGYPYIPGSSLKGKMRSLLEWAEGHMALQTNDKGEITGGKPCDCGGCDVCIIFGCASAKATKEPTRLTVRDSLPTPKTKEEWQASLGENIYTEIKTENAIDRLTSRANPRPMERITANSIFDVEIVFDLYRPQDTERLKTVFEGMVLLEDSALGGGGSRGSGKVKFENFRIIKRSVGYYKNGENEQNVDLCSNKTAKQVFDNFSQIFGLGGS